MSSASIEPGTRATGRRRSSVGNTLQVREDASFVKKDDLGYPMMQGGVERNANQVYRLSAVMMDETAAAAVAAVDNASDGGDGRQTQNDETTPQGRLTTYQIPELDDEEEEDAPSSLDNEGDEDHAQERRAEQKEHRRLSLSKPRRRIARSRSSRAVGTRSRRDLYNISE